MVQAPSAVSHCSQLHPEGHIPESMEAWAEGLWSQLLSMLPERVHSKLLTIQVLKDSVIWPEKARLGWDSTSLLMGHLVKTYSSVKQTQTFICFRGLWFLFYQHCHIWVWS